MKKILFPTDFSPAARKAYLYALTFARQVQAQMVLLHVYTLPQLKRASLPNTMTEAYENIEMEALENFKVEVKKLREIAESAGYEVPGYMPILKEGDPIKNIVRTAQQEACDLIIMGTKGVSGLKELFIGSITSGVMQIAEQMVLAVPEQTRFDGKIDQILFTTNYREDERQALEQVVAFAELFDAEMHSLHINLQPPYARGEKQQRWEETVSQYPRMRFTSLPANDFEQAISQYADQHHIDLIVMLPRERKGVQSWFRYSVSRQLTHHLSIPILGIRPR